MRLIIFVVKTSIMPQSCVSENESPHFLSSFNSTWRPLPARIYEPQAVSGSYPLTFDLKLVLLNPMREIA